jgi:hypothetical protein
MALTLIVVVGAHVMLRPVGPAAEKVAADMVQVVVDLLGQFIGRGLEHAARRVDLHPTHQVVAAFE